MSWIINLVSLLCILLIGVQSLRRRHATQWLQSRLLPSEAIDEDSFCSRFPDPENVAVAVKTGATEATEKIPMQMLTTLRCAKSVMIFSDLEQTVAGYRVTDALGNIPKIATQGNSDFDFYWRLKDAEKYGQIETMLRDISDPHEPSYLAAWTLDKYKILQILERLYAAYPNKHWYFIMDADTYLVWPNFLSWLQQLPHPNANKSYFGAPANNTQFGQGMQFAHGGSGILMSQAAVHNFAVTNKGTIPDWHKLTQEVCCGDLILGAALQQNGVPLQPSWPTVNGEKPFTIPFGPTHWCQPVVTMHHVQPHEMNQLANFERSRSLAVIHFC